jgi:glycosyltransferase involved in cell wall biosynthesis
MLTVVSKSFPPQVGGSSILLTNLLRNYPGPVNAVAGYSRSAKRDSAFARPCPTVNLWQPRIAAPLYVRLRNAFPELVRYSLQRSLQRRFRQLGTTAVMATHPFPEFLTASFCAARALGLPFYAHMHDLWLDNVVPGSTMARFGARWEPVILRQATRVCCMTEAMQAHYEGLYGITTHLLPHTISDEDLAAAPTGIRPAKMAKPTVLFVGAIDYDFNLDALKILAKASELLPPEYELLFCTPLELGSLKSLGIGSSRLQARYVSRSQVQQYQAEAHVLIAPLSHKNCSENEVRTVFSTKLLEYLVSGRPIIAFGPRDSYHAVSARKTGWAHVVDRDSPQALADAIVRVVTDQALSAQLVQGALTEARARRASGHARRLWEWVVSDSKESDDILAASR